MGKKKVKAEMENLEVTVNPIPESTETLAVEKSAKKEKKKKSKIETPEVELENLDISPVVDNDTLSKKEKKKLKKSQESTSKITNGDGTKKDARSVARTS